MDIAKLSFRLKAQIRHFSDWLSMGFPGSLSRMVSEVLYGLCRGGDIKLTVICRCLKGRAKLSNAVERVSRNLSRRDFSRTINRRLLASGSCRIGQDTLLIVDQSDIQKPYARSMEHLGRVRDGSTGKLGSGYWNLNIVATDVDSRDVFPLWGELYSIGSPTCGGENAVITHAFRDFSDELAGRGIWVMDRGFDRVRIFKELLGLRQRFVVRLVGNRSLFWRRGSDSANAVSVAMRFKAEVVRRRNGHERREKIVFGSALVRLPGFQEQLRLVKVRFEGGGTLMLLTNLEIRGTLREVLWTVKAYFSRWRVEETIRFVKQSYKLEDIRLRNYNGLRNMMALVTACANFVSLTLGLRTKLTILTRKLLDASERVAGVIKNFKYYAIADGLKQILSSSMKPWHQPKPPPSKQTAISFPRYQEMSPI